MLRVTLIGNLGGDPEIRYTAKGTEMASCNVAVSQVRKGSDGERKESTEWFRVNVSGRMLPFVRALTKGNRIMVIGRLDVGHYQAKSGEARTIFDVWADEIQSMGARVQQNGSADADEGDAEPAAARTAGRGVERVSDADLEDLPF